MTDELRELANVTLAQVIHTSSMFPTTFIRNDVDTKEVNVLHDFYQKYGEIHGYIAIVVCTFGTIANILNIIVLTRKHMISPANFILTALAMSDFLIMLTYLIFATYFFILTKPIAEYGHSIGWMYFVLIHNHFIITCHNLSTWLTVTLAVFRYIFVCRSTVAFRHTSIRRAKVAVIIVVVATVLICLPNYFSYKVTKLSEVNEGMQGYWVFHSDFLQKHIVYKVMMMWVFGAVMKIVPCIFVTLLSSLIIIKMKRGVRWRHRVLNQTQIISHDVNREHNRTTYMLLSVVILFIITELPQGVMALIAGVNDSFFNNVYFNLGYLMNLLVLINSAVNFILYCGMSRKFRDTFRSLFLSGCKIRLQKPQSLEMFSIRL